MFSTFLSIFKKNSWGKDSFGFLDPIPLCVCRHFPRPTSNSQTPAGCPTSQLNSDIIYPVRDYQVPQVKGSVLKDYPPDKATSTLQTPVTSPG